VKADYYLSKFYQGSYIEQYEAVPQSYTSSSEKANKPLSNAFDNDWLYVWQSDSYNEEQSITVTFETEESLSKIVCGLRERNPYPDGVGYPQTIKVYTSDSDANEDFCYHFSLKSSWSADKLLFVFPEAVNCKRMKLVFEDIFSLNGAGACTEVAELKFLRSDPPFDHVMRMFADEEMTDLSEEYRNDALLDEIENSIGDHLAKNFLTERIQRAKGILTGEISANVFPYPVKVYQKTGPDSERYVMAFFAEKYTVFEKEKFFSNVTSQINAVFTYEPFKSMQDKFNIYIVFVPSNESNYNYGYSTIDSYFETYITGAYDAGSTRVCMFTQNGKEKANLLFKQFREKYLDEGATIHSANFAVNTASYGGSGQTFDEGIRGVLYTYGAGSQVLVHELGHAVGNLGDEYCYAPTEKANLTAESDGYQSKWAEFMGFRYVRHVALCNGYYRPSAFCMMEDIARNFCEVCKLGLFEKVNSVAANKEKWYMADPIVYYNYNEYYPSELKDDNVFYGNGYSLRFRTVVKNFTEQEDTLVADFKITNADGSVVRCQCREEHVVAASQTKSITATTPEAVTGLVEGDKLVATVTSRRTGKVIMDYRTYKKDYGTVVTRYLIGDANTITESEICSPNTLKYAQGTEVRVEPPSLNGYIYQNSSFEGVLTVEKDAAYEVRHYYVKARGKVTLKLLDEGNNEVQSIERYIGYGETFKPSHSDFPPREGYSYMLPANEVVYDGIHDIELTYRLTDSVTKGDVVVDGDINYSDIVAVSRILLGEDADKKQYNHTAADFNGTGKVTLSDLTLLIKLLLGAGSVK